MSQAPNIEERLAEQLERPSTERSTEDPEVRQLVATAERIDAQWSELEIPDGAEIRVYSTAQQRARMQTDRRRLPRFADISWQARLATLAATAATAVVLVTTVGDKAPLGESVLANAEAAVTFTDKIVHEVYTQTITQKTSVTPKDIDTDHIESYTYVKDGYSNHLLFRSRSGKLLSEVASTPHQQREFDAETDTITISKVRGPTNVKQFDQSNPLEAMRESFGRKRVRFVGKTIFNGKPGFKLVAKLRPQEGTHSKFTYIVDRKTYLPIGLILSSRSRVKSLGVTSSGKSVRSYKSFELLTPSNKNLKLLNMGPHRGAKIVRVD